MIDIIADYYDNVDKLPLLSTVEPGYLYKLLPQEAPEEPESFAAVKNDLESKIIPGITHWQSGNFFGWFPSSGSFPSILGDMYSIMLNTVGFNWICSPAATELETIVMDWLGRLIGLDSRFLSFNEDMTEGTGGGVIQGSATEAQIVAIVHIIESDKNYRLTKCALEAAVAKDKSMGLIPFYVCATFGTTNTNAIDDIDGIAKVAAVEDMWLHVDAAYAGAALACPEFRSYAVGMDHADSISTSPHKWMLVNLSFTALWVADSAMLKYAMSMDKEYIQRTENTTSFIREYCDWQLPMSRRFRALKLWFVLRMHGVSGVRRHIRTHVEYAKWLEQQLLADGRFEIVAPVIFGLVVFRIKPQTLAKDADTAVVNQANRRLVEYIKNDGRVFLIGVEIKKTFVVRAAVGSTFVIKQNVELLLNVITELTSRIVSE
ncbi:hypothetical protein IWW48_001480 [Coemansia sp. RSA 1200]|nr:hypothetical protein IWW48_001480 [Coemansia sp. RSA 1200]